MMQLLQKQLSLSILDKQIFLSFNYPLSNQQISRCPLKSLANVLVSVGLAIAHQPRHRPVLSLPKHPGVRIFRTGLFGSLAYRAYFLPKKRKKRQLVAFIIQPPQRRYIIHSPDTRECIPVKTSAFAPTVKPAIERFPEQ